jgi:hypothetical protein
MQLLLSPLLHGDTRQRSLQRGQPVAHVVQMRPRHDFLVASTVVAASSLPVIMFGILPYTLSLVRYAFTVYLLPFLRVKFPIFSPPASPASESCDHG